jgi:hypothetical protein
MTTVIAETLNGDVGMPPFKIFVFQMNKRGNQINSGK